MLTGATLPFTSSAVLLALFDLTRLGRAADADRLAGRLGLDREGIVEALAALDRAGLVDAGRVRMTMAGLALAASLDLRRHQNAARSRGEGVRTAPTFARVA